MRSRAWAALTLLASAAGPGCAGMSCSDVGGVNGVLVSIPRALFVTSGSLDVEVCDEEGCQSMTTQLRSVPEDTPVGREEWGSFRDLGRDFEPGTVQVTVELRGPAGGVVASRTGEVELSRSYPNGKACDGDGYLEGTIGLQPEDRV